jgi:hypothetical protein
MVSPSRGEAAAAGPPACSPKTMSLCRGSRRRASTHGVMLDCAARTGATYGGFRCRAYAQLSQATSGQADTCHDVFRSMHSIVACLIVLCICTCKKVRTCFAFCKYMWSSPSSAQGCPPMSPHSGITAGVSTHTRAASCMMVETANECSQAPLAYLLARLILRPQYLRIAPAASQGPN